VKIVSRVVAACLGLLPSAALAYDWSLSTTESQTFELNDNQFMRNPSPGWSLGSYTTVNANAVALTPTSQLLVNGDVGYRKYWGPGTEGIAQTQSDWVGINAHYETWGKNREDLQYLDGSFRQSSTVVAVLGDLGLLTNVNGDLDRTMLRGGIQRSLSALDTISFSASSALTTYQPASGGTQFTDSIGTATWRHKVDPLTTIAVNSQFEWLAYDTVPSSSLMLVRNTAGFETTFSPVFSYGANIGVVYTNGEIGTLPIVPGAGLGAIGTLPIVPGTGLGAIGTLPVVPGTGPVPIFAAGSAASFIGDAHAIYRLTKDTTLNLFAAQTVAPAITGALTKRSTIHAGVTQTIDPRSSVSFAGDISRQTSSGTTNDFLSGSVSYNYQFARDWHASFTYRYLYRTGTNGAALLDPFTGLLLSGAAPASANSLLVTVSNTQILKPLGLGN
jgi:hypothetical protein